MIILTTFDLDDYVYDALSAGASGFLLKDAGAERLFEAVRVVAAGEALLAPAVTRRLIAEFARQRPRVRPAPERLSELTPRETEVLRLVAEGLSNPRSPTASCSATRRSRPTSAACSASSACATARRPWWPPTSRASSRRAALDTAPAPP